MSVGAGSIKRAAGVKPEVKEAEVKKTETKKAPAKSTAKKSTAKKTTAKKSTVKKSVIASPSKALPISNSTADKHFGVGDSLPIFLM